MRKDARSSATTLGSPRVLKAPALNVSIIMNPVAAGRLRGSRSKGRRWFKETAERDGEKEGSEEKRLERGKCAHT